MNNSVWAAGPSSPAWMHGGSYLVARRIEIALGAWDKTAVTRQERTIGRHKARGALLGDAGSAIFACPPGAQPGGYVGETLLG